MLYILILLLIPAGYLIVVSAKDIFKALKESEEAQESTKVEGLETLSKEDQERLKRELLDEMIAEKTKEKEKKDED